MQGPPVIWLALAACCGCSTPPGDRSPAMEAVRLAAPAAPAPAAEPARRVAVRCRLVDRRTGAPVDLRSHTVVTATPLRFATAARPATTVLRRTAAGFTPRFLVVALGTTIRIDNDDGICHSFFITSPAGSTKLGLMKPGSSKEVIVESAGHAGIYCSLHRGKQATVFVSPGASHAAAGPTGVFELGDLAPVPHLLEVWQQDRETVRLRVDVSSTVEGVLEVAIDSSPRRP